MELFSYWQFWAFLSAVLALALFMQREFHKERVKGIDEEIERLRNAVDDLNGFAKGLDKQED
jgi:hypothetical protein